ncbi:hypothetical protein B0J12DRAFT_745945 [Macrophomina phaseolina]|uniref:Uncharacterized protein n=1 Tax=Macrophomina phaseolina TaxID=35725 RepID=A0ABQ8FU47_9PEZI|nr:hypothetical protein B0J12DRAFT_745945 [Macrophomina phaseolina]
MSTAAVADHPPAAIPPTESNSTATADSAAIQQGKPQQQQQQPAIVDRLQLVHHLNNPAVAACELLPGHIVASPYPGRTHTLDLARLPTASALFARALQSLAPVSGDFATLPYERAFDFGALFAELRRLVAQEHGFAWPRSEFYVVAFRSVLKDAIDRDRLGLLDEKSHEEAVRSGGLLKYWFGVPDAERRNLATCFWHSRQNAADGGKGPWHKQARGAAVMYEAIRFETRRLTVEEGVSGWRWEDWKDR